MKLKKLLAICLASAMTISLAACGGAEDVTSTAVDAEEEAEDIEDDAAVSNEDEADSETPASGSDIPGYTQLDLDKYGEAEATIKFLHHKTDRQEDGTMDSMIAAFNEEFPNIKVETEAITDYAEDSLLRLSTGDWGDVMFIPAVDKTDLSNYFMPFDSLDNLSAQLNFVDNWEYDGQCYGIPYMANAQGVLYNKAVFKEAGIDKLPTTPTEFLDDLKLIKENTKAIPLYTNYAAGWTMGAWDAYVGIVTNGDDTYLNQKFVHTSEPFKDPGDDIGI